MSKTVTVALIGAGLRGMKYSGFSSQKSLGMQIVAVADPDEVRRQRAQQQFGLADERCYANWDAFFAEPRLADAVFICTRDRDHYIPAMKALECGYHVLLEKPMSPSWQECMALGKQAEKYDRKLTICHVLRYAPFFVEIKRLLDEGRIGRLMSIQHNENVGYWHQAHSYVRGYFSRSEDSSPMILAKSCHDMDIMSWLAGGACLSVASYGHLSYFRPENAPPGAPERCIDGCPVEDTCVYYAPNTYLIENGGWKAEAASNDPSYEARYRAMKEGPFGRCVFRCDNDVVDHQVVSMEFENEITAVFTMSAFTENTSRTLKLMGTEGELRATMDTDEIEVRRFGSGSTERIQLSTPDGHIGHGGGDSRLVKDFLDVIRSDGKSYSATSAHASIQSHLMAFAAERSRLEKRMVRLDEFNQEPERELEH
ncbi:Gfo/Idh/MocA family protein [Cohnella hashimotonis]|uniref:Gfo/Idh/MocA family oxidoreductase n=1 Tax=Cohnella hashimotonis TaxID=2826895 RepID=A0ABT6TS57_9BACL|nr:Gfo/Idh/MocA family oxidoreductase [Cohnella hashimotonis]MDI4649686.1 Gfo/Idh/MocA family oxidoreductase [Cohnella hashimotonis]